MRLLLASAGITNASIRAALVDLLGKPIADSTALCILPYNRMAHAGRWAADIWRHVEW